MCARVATSLDVLDVLERVDGWQIGCGHSALLLIRDDAVMTRRRGLGSMALGSRAAEESLWGCSRSCSSGGVKLW